MKLPRKSPSGRLTGTYISTCPRPVCSFPSSRLPHHKPWLRTSENGIPIHSGAGACVSPLAPSLTSIILVRCTAWTPVFWTVLEFLSIGPLVSAQVSAAVLIILDGWHFPLSTIEPEQLWKNTNLIGTLCAQNPWRLPLRCRPNLESGPPALPGSGPAHLYCFSSDHFIQLSPLSLTGLLNSPHLFAPEPLPTLSLCPECLCVFYFAQDWSNAPEENYPLALASLVFPAPTNLHSAQHPTGDCLLGTGLGRKACPPGDRPLLPHSPSPKSSLVIRVQVVFRKNKTNHMNCSTGRDRSMSYRAWRWYGLGGPFKNNSIKL